jgi:hypothetical protein
MTELLGLSEQLLEAFLNLLANAVDQFEETPWLVVGERSYTRRHGCLVDGGEAEPEEKPGA